MYVTRPLSMYRKNPTLLSSPPADGSYSGYLVCTDEETEAQDVCCFGMCSDTQVKQFPFPQNKLINIVYTSTSSGGEGQNTQVETDKVLFIPVLDQPLSSNRYYVIRAHGKHKGLACKCSTEEDMSTCCFCNCVKDVKPSLLNPRDIYQQMEFFQKRRGFYSRSVAPDGFPPGFLRRKGWSIQTSGSFECELKEAGGLDFSLRKQLPDFNFPISNKRSKTIIVGKWYCPFVFVKEQEKLKDQMKKSMFYEMNLEQWWEEIYTCENDNNYKENVVVNVNVKKEGASVLGGEAVKDGRDGVDGFVWYRNGEKELSVGLSSTIGEKMRWVEEAGGFVGWGEETHGKVEREFKGGKGWKIFGCYVLVERFALRRMDGTLLLTHDFKHTHQIQTKWE